METTHRDAEADNQRRKIRNRKNQRAHRLRKKEKDAAMSIPGPRAQGGRGTRPWQVTRWRLDEHDEPDEPAPATPPRGGKTLVVHAARRPAPTYPNVLSPADMMRAWRTTFIEFTFPLSADHLLHLVHYNVMRGLISNKRLLNDDPCSGDDAAAARRPPAVVPRDLVRTPLQRARPHSHWINFIPFPRLRDNLIRYEDCFDHWDFLQDLVGELFFPPPPERRRCTSSPTRPPSPGPAALPPRVDGPGLRLDPDQDTEVTAGRRGLIVWGEPHDMRSWEATPGFLAKWAWAVDGCDDLVIASNRWRVVRGAEPMPISLSGTSTPSPNLAQQLAV